MQDVIDGSEAAAAQVRQLDELHGRIQRGVALDRAPIDQAEISVGLIRAQQAEERALLGIIQSRLQAEEKARDESEQDTVQDPTNFDFDNTDGDGLDVYLLPGTEELAERARDAFDRAFENARRFITGDQPPNDIAGFINENELNVFERFFNSIPRAIDKLPDNVRAFFTDVNAKIVEILDSPQVVNFESFIESAFGIDVDFSQGYTNLKALLRETLPNKITEYLQNNPRTTAQVNSFVATLFGLENFDIVSFFNENDGFLSIFAIPRAIQNRWIQAVTDAEAEAGQEGENASVPFVQRLVAAFFDVDGGYTIDIPKAAGITWEYLTSPDSIPGSTLRGDLVSLWNDGKLITDALSSVGNVVGGVLNATANLVGMAIHFILGALPTADITSTEADDPFSGLLLSAILNSIFGIAILPAKALSYVVTTPVEEITLEGLVLHILGLTSENVQALFGAGNEFFNKIVPDAIRDAFGDNNLILQLYEVGNDFRQRIHEALFGQPLIGTPSREIVGGTGRGSISDAQRQAASQALQFANQQGISIQATQTLIENARTRAANEFRRNAGQDQFDFDIGQGVGRGAIDSPGIVGNIIRTIQSIPDGIEAFLSAHPKPV